MIHTDEDDEFERIAHEAEMKQQDNDDIQDYVRPWVGLTDQEIEDTIYDGFAFGHDNGNVSNQTVIRYVIRAIQAKLKEKNT